MNDWTALTVTTTTEAIEAVSNILMEAGAVGIQIKDAADFQKETVDAHGTWFDPKTVPHLASGAQVIGYFDPATSLVEQRDHIATRVRGLAQFGLDPGAATVTLADVRQADWANVWKQYYHPLRVSRFLTIVPKWEHYTPQQAGELELTLDPGMAFGTGTHPTTQLMLSLLESVIRGGETMIDVGTGSGILAIAAERLGVGDILATDVDEIAVRNAEANIKLNPVSHITVTANDLLKGITLSADLIVANILAEVLVPLIPQVRPRLKAHGHFLLAGIIDGKATLIIRTLEDNGFSIAQRREAGGWVALDAVIKETA
ncbi:50S ribosomal protein L11 methyltransferase [Lactobacillus paracasei subsp. paracasei]|uniref:50S ribosomal protein L11 methyltransferase n=1 Tax=Lacticaseibacillus paracasei TaxID=1597 RepID=UPI0018C600BE|nr:50S ribosomal protein L11 methyltransferase [Lacticaseibacillus paracasei]MBG1274871.1 50S ribosomal protein L11 methyltransferase [Lacticaseibacillus paracasei subsp. paracasei]